MSNELRLLEISTDKGKTWSQQWLTDQDILNHCEQGYLVRFPSSDFVIIPNVDFN